MKQIRIILIACLLLVYAPLQSQWTWVNPKPQGSFLSKTFLAEPDRYYATGDCGTVMQTRDGGLTWDVMNLKHPEYRFLYPFGISFPNPDTGLIIDGSGLVFQTTDGGLHYDTIATISEEVNDLWMKNCLTGIVSAGSGTIFKTYDGGFTWSLKHSDPTVFVGTISFPDDLTGYMAGTNGHIAKTTDGGETWTVLPPITTDHLYNIQFVSPDIGIVSSRYTFLRKTEDGGISWHPIDLPDSIYINDFYMFNEQVILVGGNAWNWPNDPVLYRTTDGGMNWIMVPMPENVWDIDKMECDSDGTVYFVNNNAIVKSTDYGLSWEILFEDVVQNVVSSIHFPSENVGYALGSFFYAYIDSRIVKTIDGGDTWEQVGQVLPAKFNTVFFTDELHGYLAGTGISSTIDGGETWTARDPGVNGTFYNIFFPSSLTGFAVTSEGAIVKTDNMGQSWTPISSGTTNALWGMYFPDTLNGFIAGRDVLLKTTDGGNTWSLSQPFEGDIIRGLQFLDPQTGYACGTGGTVGHGCIYKTVDGGETWQEISCYSPLNGWNALYFIDQDTGFVAGWELHTIVKTTDGGNTWIPQIVPTTAFLHTIYFASPERGFAGGWYSTLIETTNGGYTKIPGEQDHALTQSTVYPNPVDQRATIKYSLEKQDKISLEVFDLSGKQVYRITGLSQKAGTYKLPLDCSALQEGVYIYRILGNHHTSSGKMIVRH